MKFPEVGDVDWGSSLTSGLTELEEGVRAAKRLGWWALAIALTTASLLVLMLLFMVL